jgi:methionyl aminopeptidase
MTVRTKDEIEIMGEAGRRLAGALNELKRHVAVGVRTIDLDHMAYDLITKSGDSPAFLGYKPGGAGKAYPATICASVNDSVVHGLPTRYSLREGDLLKIDIGLVHKKFYADMAVTVPVGKVSREARKLIAVTERALYLGIEAAKPGNTLGDIGHAVQSYVEKNGFSVVRALTGHGIGKRLHEDPHFHNVGRKGEGEELVPGMAIAIEPMIALGGYHVKQLADDSFVTKDGSLAAHFEHTIAITERGPKILTRS